MRRPLSAREAPTLLSLVRCREILGTQCPLSDEEVKELRAQLYAVAEVALDALRSGKSPTALGDSPDPIKEDEE